ncbi:unnamed protein product [Oppiella nova]|uniref:Kinesin light chain n=1 Tax=Oppiella nova TaxID=334625 RepID=A0A7R9MG53_9ACAR|nr:unnamed protein product [Oppiella nova]CAG2176759.1 unnamed protein product [Oppiella nova]
MFQISKTTLKTKQCLSRSDHKVSTNTPKHLWCWDIITGLLLWLGVIEEPEDPLILTIKRGVYCMNCEEYSKAELILHSALQMSQDMASESAEIYVLDVLANNYFKSGDYKKAEQLFAVVFNRVLGKGMQSNDESIIEMSVKLSHIYSTSGETEKSEIGFDFCLTEQTKRVESFRDKSCDDMSPEEMNSMALLGMCYDYYGKHLSSLGRFDRAIDSLNKAIDICVKINGSTHPQTLVLYNDLSAIYVHKKDYQKAVMYLKKAIDGAVLTEDKNLAKYYLNIGFIHLLRFEKDLALNSCRQSLSLALQTSKDKTIEGMARKCMIDAGSQ